LNSQNSNLSFQAKSFVQEGDKNYDFTSILKLCAKAHKLMLKNYSDLDGKKEEDLRDILFKFMEDNRGEEEFKLGKYILNRECSEDHFLEETNVGHVDIKISIPPPSEFCSGKHKAYILECKRIDGDKEKNKAYISQGINRFIDGKYTYDMDIAGMIGFIETPKNQAKKTISEIVSGINKLIVEDFYRPNGEILKEFKGIQEINNAFKSIHDRKNNLGKIWIKHLMFDNTTN